MARIIRKTNKNITDLANAVNDLKAYVVALHRTVKADFLLAEPGNAFTSTTVVVGFHNDQSEVTVTAANGTDLPTSVALANQLRGVYEFHRLDALAHPVVDTVNAVTAAICTDLATGITLANDVKAKFNAHRTQATVHVVNDATNNVAVANATDLASLQTLVTDIKAKLNAHMASGPTGKSVRAVPA